MDKICIVSNLNNKNCDKIRNIREKVNKKFSMPLDLTYEIPHITYQGGETNNLSELIIELSNYTNTLKSFELKIVGVNNFFENVIYMQPQKDYILKKLNVEINNILKKYCENVYDYYLSENWVPHIAVKIEGLNKNNFNEVYHKINEMFEPMNDKISNIAIIKLDESTGMYNIIKEFKY